MRILKVINVLACGAMLLTATGTQAGVIHPNLQSVLDQTPPDQPVSVIVHMSEQADIGALDITLKDARATRKDRHEQVVLALQDAAKSQQSLELELRLAKNAAGVLGYTSYWISNMMVVYAVPDAIQRIADRPDVDIVEPNFTPELIEPVRRGEGWVQPDEGSKRQTGITPGLEAINADRVWYELGFNGQGRLIGSLDTGVDGNHPALASRWRGNFHPWTECWLDVLNNGSHSPVDHNSHGTHTTGTMTGMVPGDTVGVAWGAQWIATNAIGQGVGPAFNNDILVCLQWFADPDGDPGTVDDVPDVIQNSWRINEGFPGDYVDCDTRWWNAIDNCEAAGVVTCWVTGNEGPIAQTVGSPADRATSPTNSFSVGATRFFPPYAIAGFSSRGPTGCAVPEENRIKPEVVAPGVDIYSSVPGGGFEGGWDGTSMSGPHVAGTVALMRQANPDIAVDEVKLILMETAVDLGAAGEDNAYGWGFIDAYQAVTMAMIGYGQVTGMVTNASFNDMPIPGAKVELLDSDYRYTADESGLYFGYAAPGSYTARASADGFETQEYQIEVVSDQATTLDFGLNDNTSPAITTVDQLVSTSDTAGPYVVTADVFDHSTVVDVQLYYRVGNSAWQSVPMIETRGVYESELPGAPANSIIDYYFWAEDGAGLTGTAPAGAPDSFFSLYITQELYTHAAEDPGDSDWTMGLPGDAATGGLWTRADPVGVYDYEGGLWIQPEDDHTADPGVACFVTGNTEVVAGDDDVDLGCTTLLSPTFDLSTADRAFVRYWRWYAESGYSTADEFTVDVSTDGGNSWTNLETVPDNQNSWQVVSEELTDLIDLTDQVLFRFLACDNVIGGSGLVEACIDDFSVEVFSAGPTDVPGDGTTPRNPYSLAQNHPNPFNPMTKIHFAIPSAQTVRLTVYTVDGRRVATLVNEPLAAGAHEVTWNGKDSRGQQVASGTYFYKLDAGDFNDTRRMVLVK